METLSNSNIRHNVYLIIADILDVKSTTLNVVLPHSQILNTDIYVFYWTAPFISKYQSIFYNALLIPDCWITSKLYDVVVL